MDPFEQEISDVKQTLVYRLDDLSQKYFHYKVKMQNLELNDSVRQNHIDELQNQLREEREQKEMYKQRAFGVES